MVELDDPRLTLPEGGDGLRMQVNAAVLSLRKMPEPDAEQGSQLLHGEQVVLHHEDGEFGLVQSLHDRYTGWALMEGLSAPVLTPTHRVGALRAYVFPEPSIKSSPFFPVSLGAYVRCTEEKEGRFVRCERSGWLIESQLRAIADHETDPATVALRYLNTPYLWGGRESLGIDCSGLVQNAFDACGIPAPRDSDMQATWLGNPIDNWAEPGVLQRNDLIFWKGHVGIMLDDQTLLHGNGYHMAVASEPLAVAVGRIEPLYGRPTQARRVDMDAAAEKIPDWLVPITL